ncbi:hypothetical protein ACFSWE_06800 [Leucobacter albus]|uniref:LPXTG-motif cell wall-anchored protein n=1 Tax=Leucobacter albus TaxID=272210 RepID=A0ABW3TJK7_9MICO
MEKRLRMGSVLAGAAVASMLVGSLLAAPAAFATDTGAGYAPTDDAGYQEFVGGLIAADQAVTAVSQDGEGNIVVAAVAGTLAEGTVSQLAGYENVVIADRPAVLAHAMNDVVGGAGYAVNRMSVCSFGFSGWSATGTPAIITAGHCGPTGSVIDRTLPSKDDAPFFPGREPAYTPTLIDPVGTMGFSQWGGPAGLDGAEGDLDSTDIAVIDVTNGELRPLPMVTDWGSWSTEDLSLSGTPVTAVGTAKVGDSITRSGRSTGVANGTVQADDAETVVEDKSWARVCEVVDPVPAGCHWVYGFWTDAVSRPGDSGGAYMRGTTAVGVLSGGSEEFSFATDLENGLRLTPGYTVMLDLAEPAVTSAAAVAPGGVVRGTGGAGLTLTVATAASTFDVPIAGDGTWSFAAPTAAGAVSYVLQARDAGFNRSDEVPFTLTVDPALLAQPAIAAPANGATIVGQPVTFAGTGEPTSTITLSGGAAASTTVAADGAWSVTTSVDYGAATVTATQSIHGGSATTDVSFTVAPAAPAVTGLNDGAELAESPTHITGTAVPGATVAVVLDGKALAQVVARAGEGERSGLGAWSVAVPGVLAAGKHELSVTQAVGGAVSEATRGTFSVAASVTPTPKPATKTPTGHTPDQPGAGSVGVLTATGFDAQAAALAASLGGAVLLAGAALLICSRRRRSTSLRN